MSPRATNLCILLGIASVVLVLTVAIILHLALKDSSANQTRSYPCRVTFYESDHLLIEEVSAPGLTAYFIVTDCVTGERYLQSRDTPLTRLTAAK